MITPSELDLTDVGQDIEQLLAFGRAKNATDMDLRRNKPIDFVILDKIVHTNVVFTEEMERAFVGHVNMPSAHRLTAEGTNETYERGVVRHAYTLPDNSRIRIHKYPTSTPAGVSYAVRFLPERVPNRHDIGIPDDLYAAIVQAKGGLVPICGATGSGKTTTLSSIAFSLAGEMARKVVTLDEPIEYILDDKGLPGSITQVEIPTDFIRAEDAMETFMRVRPRYIIVGEVTSPLMMELVLRLSDAGHVVLCSFHTSSGPETVSRIASFFPVEQRDAIYSIIANRLIAAMSQRLVPNTDGSGVEMIPDLMLNEPAIHKCIKEGKIGEIAQQMASSDKQRPMLKSLYEAAYERKVISVVEAFAACDDREEFGRFCEGRGHAVPAELMHAL